MKMKDLPVERVVAHHNLSYGVVLELHVVMAMKSIAKLASCLTEDSTAHRPSLERSKDKNVFVARCVVQARALNSRTVKLDKAIGVRAVDVDRVLALGQDKPLSAHAIALEKTDWSTVEVRVEGIGGKTLQAPKISIVVVLALGKSVVRAGPTMTEVYFFLWHHMEVSTHSCRPHPRVWDNALSTLQ